MRVLYLGPESLSLVGLSVVSPGQYHSTVMAKSIALCPIYRSSFGMSPLPLAPVGPTFVTVSAHCRTGRLSLIPASLSLSLGVAPNKSPGGLSYPSSNGLREGTCAALSERPRGEQGLSCPSPASRPRAPFKVPRRRPRAPSMPTSAAAVGGRLGNSESESESQSQSQSQSRSRCQLPACAHQCQCRSLSKSHLSGGLLVLALPVPRGLPTWPPTLAGPRLGLPRVCQCCHWHHDVYGIWRAATVGHTVLLAVLGSCTHRCKQRPPFSRRALH